MRRQENSVLCALKDLKDMESERLADEAARQAELRARAEAEASRLRALEREAAQATAERARVEQERSALAGALDLAAERSQSLAAEVEGLRASLREREIAAAPAVAVLDPSPATPERHGWRLAALGAVAGLVTALAIIAVRQPHERVVFLPSPSAAPVAAPVAAAPVVVMPTAAPSVVAPADHRRPPLRKRPPSVAPAAAANAIANCGDDPLCGLKL